MPARRLAMRATFMPCSPSGIAQPMITSSIDGGIELRHAIERALDGGGGRARRAASRSACPSGALPTAVRTAETMTASCMMCLPTSLDRVEVGEQIFDGFADQRRLALEQMIRVFDRDQLLRLGKLRVELANLLDRNQLVALAVDDELRQRAGLQRARSRSDRPAAQCRAAARRARPRRRPSSPPTSRTTCPPPRSAGRESARCTNAMAARKSSFSPGPESNVPALRPTPLKVEAQGRHADARHRLGRLIQRLGVHRAAVQRMRMAEHGHRARLALGQIEQRFERARRARESHAESLTPSTNLSSTSGKGIGPRHEAVVAGALRARRARPSAARRDSAGSRRPARPDRARARRSRPAPAPSTVRGSANRCAVAHATRRAIFAGDAGASATRAPCVGHEPQPRRRASETPPPFPAACVPAPWRRTAGVISRGALEEALLRAIRLPRRCAAPTRAPAPCTRSRMPRRKFGRDQPAVRHAGDHCPCRVRRDRAPGPTCVT